VTLENSPAPIPYLVADRGLVIERLVHVAWPKTGPRIGIAWAGNPTIRAGTTCGDEDAVPLAAFASLQSIDGAQLIPASSEYGLGSSPAARTWAGRLPCPDPPFDPGGDGFLDTAAAHPGPAGYS
jgi:hypothetical protein